MTVTRGADGASNTWTLHAPVTVRAFAAPEIDADKQRFLDELGQIKGIGPAFIAKHGAAVLALVAAHA
jgi:hypothetical protein